MTQTTQAWLNLCHELEDWCKAQKLPYLRADDLAAQSYLTGTQRQWLTDFSNRWNALDSPTPYVYYRINQPGLKKSHQNIVRVEASSVDAQWLALCADETRIYPMEVLSPQKGLLPGYFQVLIHRLKPVSQSESEAMARQWDATAAAPY